MASICLRLNELNTAQGSHQINTSVIYEIIIPRKVSGEPTM